MRLRFAWMAIRMALFVLHGTASGAPPAEAPAGPAATRVNLLSNGLALYTRAQAVANNQLLVRVVLRGGPLLERAGEAGYAHLLEHLLLHNVPRGENVSLTEGLIAANIGPGMDFNASTVTDAISFRFALPLNEQSPTLVARLVATLTDCASLSPAALEREKAAVLEELRLKGAAPPGPRRELRQLMGSALSTPVIDAAGNAHVIANATYAGVKSFCARAVTSDRVALVLVGDVPADRYAAQLQALSTTAPDTAGQHAVTSPLRDVGAAFVTATGPGSAIAVGVAFPYVDAAPHQEPYAATRELVAIAFKTRLANLCAAVSHLSSCTATLETVGAPRRFYMMFSADTAGAPTVDQVNAFVDMVDQVVARRVDAALLKRTAASLRRNNGNLKSLTARDAAGVADGLVDCALSIGSCPTLAESPALDDASLADAASPASRYLNGWSLRRSALAVLAPHGLAEAASNIRLPAPAHEALAAGPADADDDAQVKRFLANHAAIRATAKPRIVFHPTAGATGDISLALISKAGIEAMPAHEKAAAVLCAPAMKFVGVQGIAPVRLAAFLDAASVTFDYQIGATGSSMMLTGPRDALPDMMRLLTALATLPVADDPELIRDFIARQARETQAFNGRPEIAVDTLVSKNLFGDDAFSVPIPAALMSQLDVRLLRDTCNSLRGSMRSDGLLIAAGSDLPRAQIRELGWAVDPAGAATTGRPPVLRPPAPRRDSAPLMLDSRNEGVAVHLPIRAIENSSMLQSAGLAVDILRARLMSQLRLKQGLVYSIGVSLTPELAAARRYRLKVWVPCPAPRHAQVLAVIHAELRRLADGDVSGDELALASRQIAAADARYRQDPAFAVRRLLAAGAVADTADTAGGMTMLAFEPDAFKAELKRMLQADRAIAARAIDQRASGPAQRADVAGEQ